MDADSAGPSHSIDVEFDDSFVTNASRQSMDKMMEELEQLRRGTHPLLDTERRKIRKQKAIQRERLERHRDRARDRAMHEFTTRKEEYEQQYKNRLEELEDQANKRVDEMEKHNTLEYGVIDVAKSGAAQPTFDSNKKTLRGRGGGNLIEPATYFNTNQPSRIPEFNLHLAYEDTRIRSDLNSIWNRSTSTSPKKKGHYSVSIAKPKLIIDSKSFKHGEEVSAWNRTFQVIHARLEIIGDKYISLKGVNGWDSRQVTATAEDLEEGRVTIGKLRGKDKLL